MNILFVLNGTAATSIPTEVANYLGRTNNVAIMFLYESQSLVKKKIHGTADNCTVIGCNFRKDKIAGLRKYIRVIQSGNYDIINTHHTFSGLLARVFGYKKTKTKIVHTVHADHHSYNFRQNLLIGMTINKADAVTFNSGSTEKGLYEWQRRKLKDTRKEVIFNGIDTERIDESLTGFTEQFKSENHIKHGDFVFLQVGRLIDVKNPFVTLEAFYKMILGLAEEQRLHVHLVYIGDGYHRQEIERKIREYNLSKNVHLTGVIDRESVYEMMKDSNALVVSSHYEGFCNALFEGMASGLQLIISKINVFNELIPDSEDIMRFGENDVHELKECMMKAYKTGYSIEQKMKWKKYVYDNYSIDASCRNYIDLYEELIEQN